MKPIKTGRSKRMASCGDGGPGGGAYIAGLCMTDWWQACERGAHIVGLYPVSQPARPLSQPHTHVLVLTTIHTIQQRLKKPLV